MDNTQICFLGTKHHSISSIYTGDFLIPVPIPVYHIVAFRGRCNVELSVIFGDDPAM